MQLNIKIREIQELATNGNTYMRGRRYYASGHIRDLVYNPADLTYRARIAGSGRNLYRAEIKVGKTGRPLSVACSCPAFKKYHGFCKHLVAVMLLAAEQDISETEGGNLNLPIPADDNPPFGQGTTAGEQPTTPLRSTREPAAGREARPVVRPAETTSPFSFMNNNDNPSALPTVSPKRRLARLEAQLFLNRLAYAKKRTQPIDANALGSSPADEITAARAQLLELECTLSLPSYSSKLAGLTFRFGFPGKLYVVRNIEKLLLAALNCENLHFGKFLVYRPLSQQVHPASQKIFDWLLNLYQNDREKNLYNPAVETSIFRGNTLHLNPARLRDFIELFPPEPDSTDRPTEPVLFVETSGKHKSRRVGRDFHIRRDFPPLYFELAEGRWEERSYPTDEICLLTAKCLSDNRPANLCEALTWKKEEPCFRLLSDDAGMIMDKENLYLIPENDTAFFLKPFYKALSSLSDKPGLILSEEDTGNFLNLAGPRLSRSGYLRLTNELKGRLLHVKPEIELYLDTDHTAVTGKLLFKYEDITINPHPDVDLAEAEVEAGTKSESDERPQILIRDSESEQIVLQKLQAAGFDPAAPRRFRRADLPHTNERGLYYLKDNAAIFEFLTDGLNDLKNLITIYYSSQFQKLTVQKPPRVTGHIRLDENLNLLSLDLEAGAIDPAAIRDLLAAYREKRRFIRLKDGSFFNLETLVSPRAAAVETGVQPVTQETSKAGEAEDKTDQKTSSEADLLPLLDKLDRWGAQWSDAALSMPSYRALSMDRLLQSLSLKVADGTGEAQLTTDEGYRRLNRYANDPAAADFSLPAGIKADLRNYQVTGFKWFCLLSHYGFAGILADEMGLGKTLQALSYLTYFRDLVKLPALVIAPTSLIYNWKEEAARFSPGLKAVVLTGSAEQREAILANIEQIDLLIASYTVQRMDAKQLQKIQFACCILDEAQAIKNPATHTSRAVKKIKALRRFALTGTPIENSLHELWSIFDFLMPGYLLNYKQFQSRFEQPIVRDRDQETLADLNRLTAPFILRRLKKDVLKELPEKIETRLFCDLEPEQEKIYKAYLSTARQSVRDMLKTDNSQSRKIEILSLLTRLRQICCHPALFLENYKGNSGKLETLNELLDRLFDNGSRVLLFSQFTSMLTLIRQEQEKRNRPVFYIDGSVRSEDRIDQVNRFNKGERELFLISLKAGGTGLNLTGANAVIHYDPWWNPAVEQQATDRAHRIGQKDVVQIFRLITRNSIEEKIDSLKGLKQDLVEAVIKPNQNPLERLSEEELFSLFEE